MIEQIKKCQKCGLCYNQSPLLDNEKECQVFWVGLSAQKVKADARTPLSPHTPSGKLIQMAENMCAGTVSYKTNLVKCLPLTKDQKIRYPYQHEVDCCFSHLLLEIKTMSPQIVFLLGNQVASSVSRHLDINFKKWNQYQYYFTEIGHTCYVPIHHPSYISVYRKKNVGDYIGGIKSIFDHIAGMRL